MVWHLKYGLNPHQGDAHAAFPDGREWLRVLNGQIGYVNLLDALRAWQLAQELARTLGRPAATSVKHVHPAGAALASPLEPAFRADMVFRMKPSQTSRRRTRARAPGIRSPHSAISSGFRKPSTRVVPASSPARCPMALSLRGTTIGRWPFWPPDADLPEPLTHEERQAWLAGFAPVVLSSDGYIPFRDNVDRAHGSHVGAIAQPGGSANDALVAAAADEAEIVMVHTGVRLFWHS
jgi:AICAR transformylase/IMP cyclohydrolase PurH